MIVLRFYIQEEDFIDHTHVKCHMITLSSELIDNCIT